MVPRQNLVSGKKLAARLGIEIWGTFLASMRPRQEEGKQEK